MPNDWKTGAKAVPEELKNRMAQALITHFPGYSRQAISSSIRAAEAKYRSPTVRPPTAEHLNQRLQQILGQASDIGSRVSSDEWLSSLIENLDAKDDNPFIKDFEPDELDLYERAKAANLIHIPMSGVVRKKRVKGRGWVAEDIRRKILNHLRVVTGLSANEVYLVLSGETILADLLVAEESAVSAELLYDSEAEDFEEQLATWEANDRERSKAIAQAKRRLRCGLLLEVEIFKILRQHRLITLATVCSAEKRREKEGQKK